MLWSCVLKAGKPAKLAVKKGLLMHMKTATLVVHDDLKVDDPVEGVKLVSSLDGKTSLVTILDDGIRGKVTMDQYFGEEQDISLYFEGRDGVEIHICGCYDNIPLSKAIDTNEKLDHESEDTNSGDEKFPITINRRRFLSANFPLPGERPRKRVRMDGRGGSGEFLYDYDEFFFRSGRAWDRENGGNVHDQ